VSQRTSHSHTFKKLWSLRYLLLRERATRRTKNGIAYAAWRSLQRVKEPHTRLGVRKEGKRAGMSVCGSSPFKGLRTETRSWRSCRSGDKSGSKCGYCERSSMPATARLQKSD
ncbi:hypothetical protein LTR95_018069, partial [Oleoguttula sp. CCFEE 5521]